MERNIVGIDALWGVNQWVQSAYIKLDVVPKFIRSMSQSVPCNKLYTDGKKSPSSIILLFLEAACLIFLCFWRFISFNLSDKVACCDTWIILEKILF